MKYETVNGHRIACYDNGGRSADRYTVYYLDIPDRKHTACVAMNDKPFHPQGIGMHCYGTPGRHNGKRIAFANLPLDCQRLVMQDTREGE